MDATIIELNGETWTIDSDGPNSAAFVSRLKEAADRGEIARFRRRHDGGTIEIKFCQEDV